MVENDSVRELAGLPSAPEGTEEPKDHSDADQTKQVARVSGSQNVQESSFGLHLLPSIEGWSENLVDQAVSITADPQEY